MAKTKIFFILACSLVLIGNIINYLFLEGNLISAAMGVIAMSLIIIGQVVNKEKEK